ncbi:MAG: lipid kinase MamU [Magnetospirillum sp.]|nr:lipid kinase MamU [Magnetospirillum sp.]
MRLAFVVNSSAGSFRHLPREATVAAVAEALRAAGHDVTVAVHPPRALAAALAALARESGFDAVLVGGGDGSVLSAILAGLGIRVPLGVIPLGTLNLFARDLGLPPDPVEAARRLAGAAACRIDLAEVNGTPFAIWASLGMHPWMVRRRDHLQRDGMGKWRAVALAALRALRRCPMVKVRLALRGEVVTAATPMIVVTNNAWRWGSPPTRPALDEGVLEVHVARCSSRLSLAWLAFKALLGRPLGHLIETFRADTVEVMSRKRRLMLSLDGEVTVMASPLVFRARPKALTVLMPPHGCSP